MYFYLTSRTRRQVVFSWQSYQQVLKNAYLCVVGVRLGLFLPLHLIVYRSGNTFLSSACYALESTVIGSYVDIGPIYSDINSIARTKIGIGLIDLLQVYYNIFPILLY